MTLVRVGNIVFNFDQVTYIKDKGTGTVMVELVGNKCMDVHVGADALRTWIDAHTATSFPTPGLSPNPESPIPGTN